MNSEYVYGSTRVKPKTFGDWKITEFTVSDADAKRFNLRQAFQGKPQEMISAGTFVRLEQLSTGYVVMSNTPMEMNSNQVAFRNAHGKVLVAGLGMGMILDAMLSKPEVTHIRVLENDKDIIDYVGSFYSDDDRVEIIHQDLRTYTPASDEYYDYIWLDIWDDVHPRNIDEFIELNELFSKHCEKMNLWSMDLLGCEIEDFYKIAL